MSKTAIVAVIVGIILILVIAYIVFSQPTPTLTPPSGEGPIGTATIAFIVLYTDGTQDIFESSKIYTGSLSVQPFSVIVGNKTIQQLTITVKARLETRGWQIISWASSVTQRVELYKAGQQVPLTSSTGNYPNTGTTWLNGQTMVLSSVSIPANQIESVMKTYGEGNYHLQAVAVISLQLISADNRGTTLSGGVYGGLDIAYKATGTNISALTIVSPLRPSP